VGVTDGRAELERDGYRYAIPIVPEPGDYDGQGHLNNAATVRLFNDMRIEYVFGRIGTWWTELIRDEGIIIAARELHVSYDSEGLPGEAFLGAMKYVRREGKSAILEQRIVEATTARSLARAWVVQPAVQRGTVIDWPERYFDIVGQIEGAPIPRRDRGLRQPWGPPD
jgi:acyl-CoA thioesterase FadM